MATFKLDLYERDKIIKTLITDSYEMPFGTFEDAMSFLDYTETPEGAKKIAKYLRTLLLEVFPDATEDEIRKARRSDVMKLMKSVMAYGNSEMGGDGKKNQVGAQG